MKIYLVIERDYDYSYTRGAYHSKEMAEEHSRVIDATVEEVEVSDSLPPDAQDSPEKQSERNAKNEEWRRTHEERNRSDDAMRKRVQAFNPEEHVATGGKIGLCCCRTFSQDGRFVNPYGYCGFCGGTTPEIFRKLKGESALQVEIDKLAERDRIKMRELVAG